MKKAMSETTGYLKTIKKMKTQISELRRENTKLQRNLGILETEGFIESPFLPLIKVGAGYKARPVCEKHGAMIRYNNDIWRCEECKTSVDLRDSLKWIQKEFDGVIHIT